MCALLQEENLLPVAVSTAPIRFEEKWSNPAEFYKEKENNQNTTAPGGDATCEEEEACKEIIGNL